MYWFYLAYYLLLVVISVAGLAISAIGLPGLWLMVIAATVFSLATGGTVLGWQGVAVLAGLAIASEIVEFLAGAAGSKTAGGGWRGIVGAATGGIAGGIIGVPVPLIGPILGAILGAGIGAGLFELTGHEASIQRAGSVAIGAAKGRLWGAASKLTFGLVMLIVIIIYAFPLTTDLKSDNGPPQPSAVATKPPASVSNRSSAWRR